jgi:uncharacterized protein YndB with AHSA1/START domain
VTEREHQGRAIRKEIVIHAPADAVYDAWVLPEKIAQWFVDRAENEMRAGETVKWRFDFFGMDFPIAVYETEPGKRLVFGNERPGGPPALQEVTLETDGGSTVLRLVNSGFLEGEEWDDEFEGIDSGWELALAQLRYWLETHREAKQSRHTLVMRPAKFDYEALQPHFRTAEGLAAWLGKDVGCEPEPLAVGARLRAKVDGALPLDGEVLASSPREVLVSWPEQNGALALKAFAMGPGARMIALSFRAWDRPDDEMAKVRGHLDRAVGRLAETLSPPASS